MKKLRVLILGGTGAIGQYLVKKFAHRGCEVYVSTRMSTVFFDSDNVKIVQGNALDDKFLEAVLSKIVPDIVVDFMHYGSARFKERSHILMQGNWRYVFLSSYRVFDYSPTIVENSPRLLDNSTDKEFLSTDDYSLAKARAENVLVNSDYDNWTIVRPSITYSTGRFQFGCLEANTVCFRAFQNLPVVIPAEMLAKTTTLTWGGDTAEMIYRLAVADNARCQAFNLATSQSMSWKEIGEIYNKEIGLRTCECSLDFYANLVDRYQMQYDRMFDRRLDNSKVLDATGMCASDLMPTADGLAMELRQFKKSPHYKSTAVRQNALMDKYCGTRIAMKQLTWPQRKQYYAIRYPLVSRLSPKRILSKLNRLVRGQ